MLRFNGSKNVREGQEVVGSRVRGAVELGG